MKIDITEELYQRLSTHSVGFSTHDEVITKLLDHYEAKANFDKPVIKFLPNELEFKQNLIQKKSGWKELHFNDGSVKVDEWIASRFKDTSSLKSNIWSGPLRDWRSKNIKMLILSIDKPEAADIYHSTEYEIQIGKFVKAHIDPIISFCLVDRHHIRHLLDAKWSNEILGINFPLLMGLDTIKEQGLHQRYWTTEYKVRIWSYRLCSQFGGSTLVRGKTLSEHHGEKFLKYLNEYDLLLPEFKNKEIRFIVKKM